MKTLDKIAAVLLAAFGLVHSSFTMLYMHEEHKQPLDAAWFLGSGIALIAIGMLNGLRISRPADALVRIASLLGNILATIFCVAVLHAIGPHITEAPQAIAVALIVVIELIFSAVPRR